MTEQDAKSTSAKAGPAPGSAADAAAKAPKGNPVFRMMGLPNFRFRLPSRNWMIFFTITGSWTAALLYDRREKRLRQEKWCKLVSHLAKEPLSPSQMQRRVTVMLAAPPADGLMRAREHFHEYVKPVLVASGLDWDVIEGRRQGDVRAGLAEKVRVIRKRNGEPSEEPLEDNAEESVRQLRNRAGIREWDGVQGDLVVGRHAWKEYVRGLHEGWLGPLDPPPPVPEPSATDVPLEESQYPSASPLETLSSVEAEAESSSHPSIIDDASPTAPLPSDSPTATAADSTAPSTDTNKTEEEIEASKQQQKRKQPPPFISPSEYATATLSPSCPPILGPSTAIQFPHLLGFFKFPIRMYRFLTRRYVADEIGRQTAALALAMYVPFERDDASSSTTDDLSSAFSSPSPSSESHTPLSSPTTFSANGEAEANTDAQHALPTTTYVQLRSLLKDAEAEWHKSVRNNREEGRESVWLDGMVLDERIARRMARFVVSAEEEARASRIAAGVEGERKVVGGGDDDRMV